MNRRDFIIKTGLLSCGANFVASGLAASVRSQGEESIVKSFDVWQMKSIHENDEYIVIPTHFVTIDILYFS